MVAFGACLAGLILLAALTTEDADAASRRKECRQSCGAAIEACVAQGGKRKRCKQQTLKQCRRQGLAATCATTTTTTSAGGTSTTGPGGSTTTNPGGSTTTVTTPGGTTTTVASVHGCTHVGATDLTAAPSPTVTFVDYSYNPRCARIQAGQSIMFTGDFDDHPLLGGTLGDYDSSSPIGLTSAGSTKNVTFPAAGTFPYYCGAHGFTNAMTGVVFVDP